MNFSDEIERAIFSEWRAYYFDYVYLKRVLEETWEQFPYKELFEHHEIFIENDPDPRYAFQFLIAAATFKRFNVHIADTASSSSAATPRGTPAIPPLASSPVNASKTSSCGSSGGGRNASSASAHNPLLALDRSEGLGASQSLQLTAVNLNERNEGGCAGSCDTRVMDGAGSKANSVSDGGKGDPNHFGVDVDGVLHALIQKNDLPAASGSSKSSVGGEDGDSSNSDSRSVELEPSTSLNDFQSTKVNLVDFAEHRMVESLSRRHGNGPRNVASSLTRTPGGTLSASSRFANQSFILTGNILLTPQTKEHVRLVRAIAKMALAGAAQLAHTQHPGDTHITSAMPGDQNRNPAVLVETAGVLPSLSVSTGGALNHFESATFDMDIHGDAAMDMMNQLLLVVDALAVSDVRRDIRILPSGAIATRNGSHGSSGVSKREAQEFAKGKHIVAFEGEEDATVLRRDGGMNSSGGGHNAYDRSTSPEQQQNHHASFKTMTVTGRYIIHSFLDAHRTESNTASSVPKVNDEANDLLITTVAPTGTMEERKVELAERAKELTSPIKTDNTMSSSPGSSPSARRPDGSSKNKMYDACISFKTDMILRIAALLEKIAAAPQHKSVHPFPITSSIISGGGGPGGGSTSSAAPHVCEEEDMVVSAHTGPHSHHHHHAIIDSCKLAAIDLRPKMTYSAVEFSKKHQVASKKATGGKGGKTSHVVDTIANMDFFLPDNKHQLYSGNPSIPFAIYVYQQFVSTSFREAILSEIDKVSSFYITQSRLLATSALVSVDVAKMWNQLTKPERSQLNIAFRQIYLTLDVLQQFCDINYMAILRILKNIDSLTRQDSLESYKDCVDGVNFKMGRNSRISSLQAKIVESYAEFVAEGDTKVAHLVLNTTKRGVGGVIAKSVWWSLPLLYGVAATLLVEIVTELAEAGYPILGPGSHQDHKTSPFYSNTTTTSGTGITTSYSPQDDIMLSSVDSISINHGTYLALLPLMAIFLPYLFSFNVLIWERFGINYAFILDLDPIYHFTGAELMRDSLCYIVVYLLCIFAFIKDVNNVGVGKNVWVPGEGYVCMDTALSPDFPSYIPLYAIFPIWIVMYGVRAIYNYWLDNSRLPWMLFTIGRIFTAPFHVVRFSDFFLCNQFTSMDFFYEVQFYWCTFSPDTVQEDTCKPGRAMKFLVLALLPPLGRFIQCIRRYYDEDARKRKPFPNLINMGKYLCACINIIVTFIAATITFYYPKPTNPLDEDNHKSLRDAMLGISIIIQTVTMMYQFLWDVTSDAGIWIDKNDGRGYRLRKDLVFGNFAYYVGFMVLDFSARSIWVVQRIITAVGDTQGPGSGAYVFRRYEWTFFLYAVISMVRRTAWSLFRVENEHVNNTENYRATKLTPIPQRVLNWDSTTDNMAERFAKMKGVQSEEFPSIRGYNLTTLTRFFANLPEKEKVAILNSNPKMIKRHAAWHVKRLKKTFTDNNKNNKIDPMTTTTMTPVTAADGEQQPLLFTGVKNEGKSRFFSELPEEVKALLLLGYLKGETMGGFKTRVTAEEIAVDAAIKMSASTVLQQGAL